jgi:predicted ATP-grasp superfamily ATP-dependent carboligase
MSKALNVLVTDGEQRAALAVVRSLGRAGHKVFVCSHVQKSIAGGSRFAVDEAVVPSPTADPGGFQNRLEDLVSRWNIDVLLPIGEASVLCVLSVRHRLGSVTVPFPEAADFDRICDKAAVLETAAELGIKVPEQRLVKSPNDLASMDLTSLKYPMVVKAAKSVVQAKGGQMKTNVLHVRQPDRLRQTLTSFPEQAFPLLLQQRIVGPGVGVFVLLWQERVIASFGHRRIREKPPSGGVSVLRESVGVDSALYESSIALLRALNWNGVAMVEYKMSREGIPYLMEINGRFWGSLQLAVDAGVDFPSLLVSAAIGEDVEPVTSYHVGVRSRWTLGEADHLIARCRYSSEDLALAEDEPSMFGAILQFLGAFRPGVLEEVCRLSDPEPGRREFLAWLRRG